MPNLAGTMTHENLSEAFAGESQANRRYLWSAQKADVEGYPDTAALFRSVAEGETGHARGRLEYLAEVGDPASGEPIGDPEGEPQGDPSRAKRTSTPKCTPASQRPLATKDSTRSPTGSRRSPGLRRVTPESSPKDWPPSEACLTIHPNDDHVRPKASALSRRS